MLKLEVSFGNLVEIERDLPPLPKGILVSAFSYAPVSPSQGKVKTPLFTHENPNLLPFIKAEWGDHLVVL